MGTLGNWIIIMTVELFLQPFCRKLVLEVRKKYIKGYLIEMLLGYVSFGKYFLNIKFKFGGGIFRNVG